jgi:hypothetical protein
MRARFGFKHKTTDKITMGLRFATASNGLQSPHQDMAIAGGNKENFGLDRAYIETKWGEGGFLWLGKHGISFWEQNEQFWDGDIQPEGAGVGYKLGLGDDASLLLQSTYTLINEEGWSNQNNGVGEDDSAYSLQAVLTKGGATAAIGRLAVQDDNDADLPGGSADYYIASVQFKTSTALPIKLGADFMWSEDTHRNGATLDVTGITNGDEDQGYVLNASTKKGNWSLQFKHYDIESNSVPLSGQVSQDNFRFSSNFEGQRYQVGYNFGNGVSMDGRVYDQDQKRSDLTIAANDSWTMGSEDNTRYQVNLNAKF